MSEESEVWWDGWRVGMILGVQKGIQAEKRRRARESAPQRYATILAYYQRLHADNTVEDRISATAKTLGLSKTTVKAAVDRAMKGGA